MEKRTLLEVFDDAFQSEIRQARNYPEAYERASEKFERQHGFIVPFNGYDSFRRKKMTKVRKTRY